MSTAAALPPPIAQSAQNYQEAAMADWLNGQTVELITNVVGIPRIPSRDFSQ